MVIVHQIQVRVGTRSRRRAPPRWWVLDVRATTEHARNATSKSTEVSRFFLLI